MYTIRARRVDQIEWSEPVRYRTDRAGAIIRALHSLGCSRRYNELAVEHRFPGGNTSHVQLGYWFHGGNAYTCSATYIVQEAS